MPGKDSQPVDPILLTGTPPPELAGTPVDPSHPSFAAEVRRRHAAQFAVWEQLAARERPLVAVASQRLPYDAIIALWRDPATPPGRAIVFAPRALTHLRLLSAYSAFSSDEARAREPRRRRIVWHALEETVVQEGADVWREAAWPLPNRVTRRRGTRRLLLKLESEPTTHLDGVGPVRMLLPPSPPPPPRQFGFVPRFIGWAAKPVWRVVNRLTRGW